MKKTQIVSKGILNSPPYSESGYYHTQTLQVAVNEPYRIMPSGQESTDPVENTENNYIFPRKRKFIDNSEIYFGKLIDTRPKSADSVAESKLNRTESSTVRENESIVSENTIKNGSELQTESFNEQNQDKSEGLKSDQFLEFKAELNKEIDKLRKILENQIDTGRTIEIHENNQRMLKLKKSFEENLNKVLSQVQSSEKIKEIEENVEKIKKSMKGLDKLQDIEGKIEFVYKGLVEIQGQIEKDKKNYLAGLVNIVPIVQGYMKASNETLELKLKEIERKAQDLKQTENPAALYKAFFHYKPKRLGTEYKRKNYPRTGFKDCLSYYEFSRIFEDHLDKIPRWHKMNLLGTLGCLDADEKNNPFWLEYLRMNCANGRNRFIDSRNWTWLPYEGPIKEKIKHYVTNWEFIDCETLNFVRNELGLDQVLVLGGESFPYRITYLKCKWASIPIWWNELIQELRGKGLQVVLKVDKESGETRRIIQIWRNVTGAA